MHHFVAHGELSCTVGQRIESAEDILVVLEAAKTEVNVNAGEENIGRVVKGVGRNVVEGSTVQAGERRSW